VSFQRKAVSRPDHAGRAESVQRTVELPSSVTGRCPLTCGDGRRVAPKSPEIGQSRRAWSADGHGIVGGPRSAHLASWARWVPQVTSSGGKRKGSNATGRGNPYLGAAVGEAVVNAGRTSTFLGARYHRMCKRMPKRKAQRAIGNSVFRIYHDLLSDPEATYTDLGPGYYEQKMHTARQIRSHARATERHGCKVTIEAIDPGTGEPWPGSAPTRTAWITWSGCGGRVGLPARAAVMQAPGGWTTAGSSAAAAGSGPR
jgi:Transposase IS116/IS110/IS902 family